MIEYHSIQNILDLCKEQDKKIWEVVLQADMDESGASGEQVFEKMRFMYRAMQEADQSYEANLSLRAEWLVETVKKCVSIMPLGKIYAVSIQSCNGKSIEDGRIECLYEKNRSSAYRRFLWSDSSSSFKL